MILKKLLDSLAGLAGVLEASGAKKPAAGVRTIQSALAGDPERDAQEALDELRVLLQREKDALILSYLDRLHGAGTDEVAFSIVHKDLTGHSLIGKEEADKIAHQYTGGRQKWASRKASLDAIKKKFVERAYQESKMKVVRNYKVG